MKASVLSVSCQIYKNALFSNIFEVIWTIIKHKNTTCLYNLDKLLILHALTILRKH